MPICGPRSQSTSNIKGGTIRKAVFLLVAVIVLVSLVAGCNEGENDTTAPHISEISTRDLATTSIVVTWTTDEPATSKVDYGLTASYGSTTTLDANLVINHSVSLSGLSPSTTYHYDVKSKDGVNNEAVSGDYSFTTAALPDTTPAVISGVGSSNITTSSATISWTTDEPATSKVDYGLTTSYGSTTTLDANLVTTHTVVLIGLSPNNTYHYRVRSKDSSGNEAVSSDQVFVMPDTIAPTIEGLSASNIGEAGATLVWTTNEPATSQVEYGATIAYGSVSSLDSTLVTGHSVSLNGLQPGTTYHYRVKSKDAAGNEAASSDGSFDTVSLWQVTILSTMAQSALDSQWGLDNPNKVFVVVQLSLLPVSPDSNSIDMMSILLTYSAQQSLPVGLKIGGQWHMATSGSCQITVLGENSAEFEFDTLFEYPNAQDINGGFTGSRQEQGTLQVQSSQGALSMTFAYVISEADVQAGGLQLKLPGTQLVTLVVG